MELTYNLSSGDGDAPDSQSLNVLSICKNQSIFAVHNILFSVHEMNKKSMIYVRGLAHFAFKYVTRLEITKQGCTFLYNDMFGTVRTYLLLCTDSGGNQYSQVLLW